MLTTADAAKILDLTPDAVRLLERQGKLPADRTPSGRRVFQREEVERVARERQAAAAARARK